MKEEEDDQEVQEVVEGKKMPGANSIFETSSVPRFLHQGTAKVKEEEEEIKRR